MKEVWGSIGSRESGRRMIRARGFRGLSPHPFHPKADLKNQSECRGRCKAIVADVLPNSVDLSNVDVDFQDDARVGQNGLRSRIGARLGVRPPIVRDYRYGGGDHFRAICPQTGAAVGHICDRAITDDMNPYLMDFSDTIPVGRHGWVSLERAGWLVRKT